MKRQYQFLLIFVATVFINRQSAFAQTPRFEKYAVMETGAALYLPAVPEFDLSYSEDSSIVYTCEVEVNDIDYGAIIIQLSENLGDNPSDWEALLVSYMEYLADGAFDLTQYADPGYGHTLDSYPNAHGILMYGVDENDLNYVIKGWVDGKMIAVLYVDFLDEMNYNIQSLFLDGFRFPEKN